MKSKQIMGKVSFGYSELVMPLEVAHKIQTLLAEHAHRIDMQYPANHRAGTVSALREYEVGSVEVVKDITFDARGVDNDTYTAWASAIRDREEGDTVMSPQDFANIKGGE
jgi:hypothetical protein